MISPGALSAAASTCNQVRCLLLGWTCLGTMASSAAASTCNIGYFSYSNEGKPGALSAAVATLHWVSYIDVNVVNRAIRQQRNAFEHSPNCRGVRVAWVRAFTPAEGNRRAWRNGRGSASPTRIPSSDSQRSHRCMGAPLSMLMRVCERELSFGGNINASA